MTGRSIPRRRGRADARSSARTARRLRPGLPRLPRLPRLRHPMPSDPGGSEAAIFVRAIGRSAQRRDRRRGAVSRATIWRWSSATSMEITTGGSDRPPFSCARSAARSGCCSMRGRAATPPSAREGLSSDDLGAVVLSHFHGDHYGGFPFLELDAMRSGRTVPLLVLGTPAKTCWGRGNASKRSGNASTPTSPSALPKRSRKRCPARWPACRRAWEAVRREPSPPAINRKHGLFRAPGGGGV